MFSESSSVTSATCNSVSPLGGMLILDGSSSQDPTAFNVVFGSDSSIVSLYYSSYLLATYRTCRTVSRRNVSACEALGNLCVLNLYNNVQSNKVDACQAFNSIPKTSSSSGGTNVVWGDNMPWLTYTETYGTFLSYYSSTGTSDTSAQYIYLKFDNKCQNSLLNFISAEYSLNGSLLRTGNFDVNRLQLCNILSVDSETPQVSPFSATNFQQSCSINLKSLLNFGASPVFYDLFLQYASNSKMLPVPVQTLNYIDPTTGTQINRDSNLNNHKLQRRFFLVESVSSVAAQNAQAKYVRYAKSIVLYFGLVENQNQGKLYPPFVIIDYDFASTDDLTKSVTVNFQIQYLMNLDSQVHAIWISVGILAFLSILWAIFRSWIWSRRSGKLAVDVISLFKFLMFLITGLSNVFFVVTIGVSFYWLIFYKGQNLAYVLLPQSYQEYSFIAVLILSLIFKFIDVLYLILVQCSYDVFFIDWERPKIEQNIDNIPVKRSNDKSSEKRANDEIKSYNKVSCWRSLFVANEWNEIQTFRKINPTIQLIFVLFFLKVVNLEALTTSDCNISINPDPKLYQGAYSGILRVAMASAVFIAFGKSFLDFLNDILRNGFRLQFLIVLSKYFTNLVKLRGVSHKNCIWSFFNFLIPHRVLTLTLYFSFQFFYFLFY